MINCESLNSFLSLSQSSRSILTKPLKSGFRAVFGAKRNLPLIDKFTMSHPFSIKDINASLIEIWVIYLDECVISGKQLQEISQLEIN